MSTYNEEWHDARISQLYRAGSREEPPEQLDRMIRAHAHRVVARHRRPLLMGGLATAAVVMLSLGLILKSLDQAPLQEALDLVPAETESAVMSGWEPAERKRFKSSAPSSPRPSMLPEQAEEEDPFEDLFRDTQSDAGMSIQQADISDCLSIHYPASPDESVWQQALRMQLQAADSRAAECLRQAFFNRFGRELPPHNGEEGSDGR